MGLSGFHGNCKDHLMMGGDDEEGQREGESLEAPGRGWGFILRQRLGGREGSGGVTSHDIYWPYLWLSELMAEQGNCLDLGDRAVYWGLRVTQRSGQKLGGRAGSLPLCPRVDSMCSLGHQSRLFSVCLH